MERRHCKIHYKLSNSRQSRSILGINSHTNVYKAIVYILGNWNMYDLALGPAIACSQCH